TALRQFAQTRGDAELSRVVGVVGFNGQDQPRQWLLLQLDAKTPNLLHEYAMLDGRIAAHRQFWRDPKQDLPTIPINVPKITFDSAQAFRLADQAAKRVGMGFDSIHYNLRCRDLRNEPVWMLNLIDGAQNSVGVLYISAVTGETLRSVWHRPGTMTTSTSAPTPPPGAPTPDQVEFQKRPKGLIPQLVEKVRSRNDAGQAPPPPSTFSAPRQR
ncbi:MAG: hypothetical protein KDN20_06450, partial [Verrucomicrobiae bacterium]|nr:hypothetical protein [Verrucomicrobiae bacterium]